jgi:hypothetical protein
MALVPAMPDIEDPLPNAWLALRSLAIAVVGFLAGLVLAAIAIPVAAHAQIGPVENSPPKTRSVIVYGDDPCPKGDSDEIVVCARQPENDRYRIPKQFRGKKSGPVARSWSSNVRSDDDASRMAAGVPNTCSAVGSGGQSGCFLQFQQQAAEARRQTQQSKADQDGSPNNP